MGTRCGSFKLDQQQLLSNKLYLITLTIIITHSDRVGYSRGYGDLISHKIMGAYTKFFKKCKRCCRILSFTENTLFFDRKFLLATGIFYQLQEIYIFWNEICTYLNRNPSCDSYLHVAGNFFCHKKCLPILWYFCLWH